MRECDGVFEGGGVRGIGLAGAVCAFMRGNYIFKDVAGSSAGAIIASLVAAGFSCGEIESEMKKLDYKRFKGKDFLDNMGLPGKLASLSKSFGIYNLNYLEEWLGGLLDSKDIVSFGDLTCSDKAAGKYSFKKNKSRLSVTATDLTAGKLLVLPDDLALFGIQPESFSVATAVRMSAGIPLFYEPFRLKDKDGKTHYIVDGGLLSNYPAWILDKGGSLTRPVFGFRFSEEKKAKKDEAGKLNLFEYIQTVISTVLDVQDTRYAYTVKGDKERTVHIPVEVTVNGKEKAVSGIAFDLSDAQSEALFKNGLTAASEFLKSWDFADWKNKYR